MQPQPEPHDRSAQPESEPLQPGTHLRLSVLAFVAVNLIYGLPIVLWPDLIWDTVAGADADAIEILRSMRWAGAILVAWAIGGMLVLTRPRGRQTMVTTFALQESFAAVAIGISLFGGEFDYVDTWFPVVSLIVVAAGAAYLWYARWAGRDVLTA